MVRQTVPSLGICCACDGTHRVRNIIMLSRLCPTPGKGWGCLQCGLAENGAVAVLCDACFAAEREPRYVCTGYPGSDGRTPIEALPPDVFEHDFALHPETHGEESAGR